MLTKRIIPCLDIKNGRTVKGVNFLNLKDAGDPVKLGYEYSLKGADELIFLDISATQEERKTTQTLVREIAKKIAIPFTVGGGISSVKDAEILLKNGADKISVNSSALKKPGLINALASKFGSQCIVVAIDARFINNQWKVFASGGTIQTHRELIEWALEAESRGAGEILFTSMDHDGTKKGFANDILFNLSQQLKIPVIASGGAGTVQHFIDAFTKGNCDAALAASIFHFGEIELSDLKTKLKNNNIEIRL